MTQPLKSLTTKIGSGATPKGGKTAYKEKGVSLIRSMNVYDTGFRYKELACIDNEQAKKLDNVAVQEEDVLLNITGASVARTCMVPSGILPARVNQHVAIIRANKNLLDPYYLRLLLVTPNVKNRLLAISASGATREALTKEYLEKFEVDIPDINTQKRHGGMLRNYEKLVENNFKRIEKLEAIARLLFRHCIVGSKTIDTYALQDISSIPRETVTANKLIAGTNYIGLEHIPRKSFGFKSIGKIDKELSLKIKFEAGDILFGKIRPYFHKVAPAPVDGVTSSDTIVIRPDSEHYGLILMTVSSNDFIAHSTQSSNGTKMPRANWDVLKKYEIPMIDPVIEAEFNNQIITIVKLIRNLTLRNELLAQARDLILPRIMAGDTKI